MFGQCKFCRSTTDLIKAHILPRQYFHRIKGSQKHLICYKVGSDEKSEYMQAGIWDDNILCGKCDGIFGVWDDYSYKILSSSFAPSQLAFDNLAVTIGAVDFDKFKLFCLSLLWRVSITTQPAFARVRLGPHQKAVYDLLVNRDPDDSGIYAPVLIRYQPKDFGGIFWNAQDLRMGKINCYFFYIPPFKLLIKVDKRPFEDPFCLLTLKRNALLYAVIQEKYSRGEIFMLEQTRSDLKKRSSR